MPILALKFIENAVENLFEIFSRIPEILVITTPHTLQMMDTPSSAPPLRPKGGELSVGRRIAIVVKDGDSGDD